MDKKLIKEFPFLEGLEKEFGELGHVRVKRVTQDVIKSVRDLPAQSGSVIKHCVKEIPSSKKDEGLLFYRFELVPNSPLESLIASIIYKYTKEDNKMSNTINLFGNEFSAKEISVTLNDSKVILGYLLSGIAESECPDTFIPYWNTNGAYSILNKIERDEFSLIIDVELHLEDHHLGTYHIEAYPVGSGEPKVILKGEEQQKEYFAYEIERDNKFNVISLKPLKGFNESLSTDNGFYITSEDIGLVSNLDETAAIKVQEFPDYVKTIESNSNCFLMIFNEPLGNETIIAYAQGKLKLDYVS